MDKNKEKEEAAGKDPFLQKWEELRRLSLENLAAGLEGEAAKDFPARGIGKRTREALQILGMLEDLENALRSWRLSYFVEDENEVRQAVATALYEARQIASDNLLDSIREGLTEKGGCV